MAWRGAVSAAGAMGAILMLGACQDFSSGPDLLDDQITSAAALVAADAVLEDLSAMNDAFGGAAGAPGMGGGGMMGPRQGLVRDRVVTFFDASGAEQDERDPLTTASIHTVMTVTGDIARDNFSASIDRSRDLWVTGLEGEETQRAWNGTGAQSHTRTRIDDDLGNRSFSLVGDATTTDVVRAVDREEHPWPLSGSITRHVVITVENGPNGDEVRERTVVTVFNGTQFATLTVNGEVFEVDLAAGDNRNPLRRPRGGRGGGGG